jgi:uncharacterized protein (TIRG00374 family)
MNKKKIIKIVISILLMGYLLWEANIHELLNLLKAVDIPLLVLIYSACVPGILFCTYKWKVLLQAQGINSPGFLRLWALYHMGGFFSNFLPSDIGGDLVRSYAVGRANNKQAESFAAVAVERISGFVAMIFYGIIGIFINCQLAVELNLIYIFAGSVFLVFVFICLFLNRKFAKWLMKAFNYTPLKKIVPKINKLYESFYLYKQKKYILFYVMILSFVFQLYAIWYPYALLITTGTHLSYFNFMLIFPAIMVISIIPITINSIGVREGAFVYFFSHMGISSSQALVLALLYRVGVLLPSLIGGLIYMFGDLSKREVISAQP